MNKLSMGVFRCSSVSEILKYIRAITSHRAPIKYGVEGNDSNLLIVFYVQIMPDDFVMQLHRF